MFQWRLGQTASFLRRSGGVLVGEVRIYCLEPTDSEVEIGSSERRGRSSALRARVVDASSVGMTRGPQHTVGECPGEWAPRGSETQARATYRRGPHVGTGEISGLHGGGFLVG
jgi:hypothetical protein